MNCKKIFISLAILMYAFLANAENPAFSSEEGIFEQSLKCTQSQVRPIISQFIDQATPVINAIKHYVRRYEDICRRGTNPNTTDIQPIVVALTEVRSQLQAYEAYQENSGDNADIYLLRKLLVATNSDLSLENLYRGRAIHWSLNFRLDENLKKQISDLYSAQADEVKNFYKMAEYIFAALKYHRNFENNIELIARTIPLVKSETKCLLVSGDFLKYTQASLLPKWSSLTSTNESETLVGKFSQGSPECR